MIFYSQQGHSKNPTFNHPKPPFWILLFYFFFTTPEPHLQISEALTFQDFLEGKPLEVTEMLNWQTDTMEKEWDTF